jgi:mRNA interferase MazF
VPSLPNPKRGDIVRVRLDPVEGSEQAGERPALVISPDVINEHSPVILIAALTSQKTERVYPFEVLVEPPEGGLRRRSKVLLMQLRAVDKRRCQRTLRHGQRCVPAPRRRRPQGGDRVDEDVKGETSWKAGA